MNKEEFIMTNYPEYPCTICPWNNESSYMLGLTPNPCSCSRLENYYDEMDELEEEEDEDNE